MQRQEILRASSQQFGKCLSRFMKFCASKLLCTHHHTASHLTFRQSELKLDLDLKDSLTKLVLWGVDVTSGRNSTQIAPVQSCPNPLQMVDLIKVASVPWACNGWIIAGNYIYLYYKTNRHKQKISCSFELMMLVEYGVHLCLPNISHESTFGSFVALQVLRQQDGSNKSILDSEFESHKIIENTFCSLSNFTWINFSFFCEPRKSWWQGTGTCIIDFLPATFKQSSLVQGALLSIHLGPFSCLIWTKWLKHQSNFIRYSQVFLMNPPL